MNPVVSWTQGEVMTTHSNHNVQILHEEFYLEIKVKRLILAQHDTLTH